MQEVNIDMKLISLRNICIASIISLLISVIWLFYRGVIADFSDVLIFMLISLGTGSAMLSAAIEKDYEISIEDRILGIESEKAKESKNKYNPTMMDKKVLNFAFIAVIVFNWLYAFIIDGSFWYIFTLIKLLIYTFMIGVILSSSVKLMSKLQGSVRENALYLFMNCMAIIGVSLFYASLFGDKVDATLHLLPVVAIIAGIFTAIELVILNGLYEISAWKNLLGLSSHLIFPLGIALVLVLANNFANNLSGLNLELLIKKYIVVAIIYIAYLLPGLIVGFLGTQTIRKIIRD